MIVAKLWLKLWARSKGFEGLIYAAAHMSPVVVLCEFASLAQLLKHRSAALA